MPDPVKSETTPPANWRERLAAETDVALADLKETGDTPESYERGYYEAICWVWLMMTGVPVP